VTTDLQRVTIVDDHSLFAEALTIALAGEGLTSQCVVPHADLCDPARLESAVLSTAPDLVLMDLDLGSGLDGMSLVPALVARGVSVVVVTGAGDPARRGEALHRGAAGVIAKTQPFGTILETVRRMREGFPVISREERRSLLALWRAATSADRDLRRRFDSITRREAEVLGLMMAGHQVSEIARSRYVSESTVRTQVKSILAKLQVSSQLTAVGLAHQIGWQPPTEPAIRSRAEARPASGGPARTRVAAHLRSVAG